MTRKLAALGLLLAAALTSSAMAAPIASAFEHTFEATAAPVALTGDDDGGAHGFSLEGSTWQCETSTFSGTLGESTADQITLTPSYSNCAVGSTPITVTNEGCSFVFDSDTTTDPNTGTESGTMSVKCEEKAETKTFLKFSGPGCTIDIGTQGPLHGVKYYNNGGIGSNEAVTMEAHVFGIEYNATNNGCALLGVKKGVHTNGTLIGNTTLRAYKDGQTHSEANQVGFRVTTP